MSDQLLSLELDIAPESTGSSVLLMCVVSFGYWLGGLYGNYTVLKKAFLFK